jgi:hypothetical protein
MLHACLDAVEVIVAENARSKGRTRSGPKWPASLILGEEAESKVSQGEDNDNTKSATRSARKKPKTNRPRAFPAAP